MATAKSPFLVIQDFLSPKICEQIVTDLDFLSPDMDPDGNPLKMYRSHEGCQMVIYKKLMEQIDSISKYYGVDYKGTEEMMFEYLAGGVTTDPICENSNYLRKKWVRVKDRDLTGVLFFSDYNQEIPFDNDFEVYGGKLEFPQHGFSFQPTRGTLVIYPSGPHFINANAEVIAGDLFQVRIHIATKLPYLYNPREFPGDYRTWFKHLM